MENTDACANYTVNHKFMVSLAIPLDVLNINAKIYHINNGQDDK